MGLRSQLGWMRNGAGANQRHDEIAVAHGGNLRLVRSDQSGTVFEVLLRRVPPAA